MNILLFVYDIVSDKTTKDCKKNKITMFMIEKFCITVYRFFSIL